MIRKVSRIIQIIRDAILILLSIVFISTSIGPGKEFSNLFFAGICSVILALSVINVVLNAFRFQGKGYFRGNSIFLLALGLFLSIGLFPPLGIVLVVFNIMVLVSLYEKKSPEERLKNPPKPLTKKYRGLIGAGVLVMFLALWISWLNSTSLPLISVYLGQADLVEVSKLVTNPAAQMLGFLGLVGSPVSIVLGLLGLVKRKIAWASGILAVAAGVGWIASMATLSGVGVVVFLIGGAIVLAAPIIAK